MELPVAPALALTIVNLLAPYATALLNRPAWSANSKRLIAVAVSLALSAVSLAIYYGISGEPVPSLPVLFVLGILVSQTAYALIEKPSAKALEEATSAPRG